MDAATLLEIGKQPGAWLRKSVELRWAADALWASFDASVAAWIRTPLNQLSSLEPSPEMTFYAAAQMLYGLSLETAFKGVILRDRPHEVEFTLVLDGTGAVASAEMKQLGVSLGAGHDLVKLAERAGVFRPDRDALFAGSEDVASARSVLEELSEAVVWSGRYPIPRRSSASPDETMDRLVRLQGHHFRKWIDPILDRLQGGE